MLNQQRDKVNANHLELARQSNHVRAYVDTCVVSVPINSRQGQKQTSLCRAQERKEIDDYGKNDE